MRKRRNTEQRQAALRMQIMSSKTTGTIYSYNAYQKGINDEIVTLTKEGVGIRSTARILDISPTTLLSRIVQIAHTISRPPVINQRTYDMDEIKALYEESPNTSE